MGRTLDALRAEIVSCHACPRLVTWRERIATEKVARFRHQEYWGRPVPGFGDPAARLLVVGLAPAAHGGNRTGRVFTGDKSGDWLYRALHRAGFANQPTSVAADDGLALRDCYIVAVVRCAPPDNKPTPDETLTCRPFLEREIPLLPNLNTFLALGKFAFDNLLESLKILGVPVPSPRPAFGHGVEYVLPNGATLIGSYHPSQRNTSTKLLTEPMFDAIFSRARAAIER